MAGSCRSLGSSARLLCVSLLVAVAATATATLVTTARAAGPTLTANAYRARANTICAQFNKYSPPATDTEIEQLSLELKTARAGVASIKKLRPPSSLAPLQAQVIKVLDSGFDLYAAKLAQVKAGKLSVSQFSNALDHTTYSAQEVALWKKIGATVCAKP
jgi:hypothetical protein